ncbi:MAG: hypothetical protein ACFCGT_09990 [Sandaracinaceae bacterium]
MTTRTMMCAVVLGFLVGLLLAGCSPRIGPFTGSDSGTFPPTSEELGETACSDGRDNDGDGAVDCDDLPCCAVTACAAAARCRALDAGPAGCVPEAEEETAALCGDRRDNDCDGRLDCQDLDCIGTCGVEASNPACLDGVDNDRDGFVDCEDFGCAELAACAGESTNRACADGVDNDGDGAADCEDEGCQGEAIVVCDGPTGIAVPEMEVPGSVGVRCSNGVSDDGDPFVDCRDFSCQINHLGCRPAPPEGSNGTCADGVDNDADGPVDCADPGCGAEGIVVCADGAATGLPEAAWAEVANARCSDGVDNDDDGYTDCDDFGCAAIPEVTACFAEENSEVKCTDGVDNDRDGRVDCEELTCGRRNPFLRVCEADVELCTNGLDDDGNGFGDCDDFTCRGPFAGWCFR